MLGSYDNDFCWLNNPEMNFMGWRLFLGVCLGWLISDKGGLLNHYKYFLTFLK